MTSGAIVAALMLVVFVIGWPGVGLLVFAGGVYYGMKRFRRETGGYIRYFKAWYAGCQTAFFTSLILAFVGYVTVTMNPMLIGMMLDMMEQQLKASGMPQRLTEMAVQQWREILTPAVVGAITIFMYSAIGFAFAMVCAVFVQNDHTSRLPDKIERV
jgi:hypothetical protein